MKKLTVIVLTAMASCLSLNAQTVIGSSFGVNSGSTTQSADTSSSDDSEQTQNGTDFIYHGIEKGWGASMETVWNHFLFGFGYYSGETNDYLKTNNGFELFLGGNYRFFLANNFYVEGRLMAGWYSWSTEFKAGKSSSRDDVNKLFVGVSPRIGIQFGKVAISGGYRWDYVDFEFDKDHCLDRWNVGLTVFW